MESKDQMTTTEKRELLIAKFINGKVTYDKHGGQYFWINPQGVSYKPQGEIRMLAEMRGWGHIQNMFKDNKGNIDEDAAAKFQDMVGDFIADAINEKMERQWILHTALPDEGEKVDKRIKLCSAAIHGFLDGYELDNSSDVIEKSEVINNLKTILTLLK